MAATRRAPASSLALVAMLLLSAPFAQAGGPLVIRSNGTPYVWSTTSPIPYRTDNGPLSATVTESMARARVQAMFNVWQNVASSSISFSRAGFINDVGAFTDGDVSTGAEYNAIRDGCINATQNAIIYDADGTIFTDLGYDVTSILGFAGPCALNTVNFVAGDAVMNGLFIDGQPAPVQDIPAAAFDAVFVHEFGHFSGLDHSQINVNCNGPFGCSTRRPDRPADDVPAAARRVAGRSCRWTTSRGSRGSIRRPGPAGLRRLTARSPAPSSSRTASRMRSWST